MAPAVIEPSLPLDTDTMQTSDMSDLRPAEACITVYPGFKDYPLWLEQQFPSIVPPGTANYLQQLQFTGEEDLSLFWAQSGAEHCELIGPQVYDMIRDSLADLKVIWDFIRLQDPVAPYYPFVDFLHFRDAQKPAQLAAYPESQHLMSILQANSLPDPPLDDTPPLVHMPKASTPLRVTPPLVPR